MNTKRIRLPTRLLIIGAFALLILAIGPGLALAFHKDGKDQGLGLGVVLHDNNGCADQDMGIMGLFLGKDKHKHLDDDEHPSNSGVGHTTHHEDDEEGSDCYQLDLFYGDLIEDFQDGTVRYGERLLSAERVIEKSEDMSDDDEGAVAIRGIKYHDLNSDGVRDTMTESGLAGWTIELRSSSGEILSTATTDADGIYEFNDLAAGMYVVCEEPQANWGQTQPLSYNACHTVSLEDEDVWRNFGNIEIEEGGVCVPNPELHLRGVIMPGTGKAMVMNHSQACSYDIGLASYEIGLFNKQTLHDHTEMTIGPGETAELEVELP